MLNNVFKRIDNLLKHKDFVVVAIDGKCCSGKSSLGDMLKEKYDAVLIRTDDFYLPQEARTEQRMKEIAGHMDYERFNDDVVSNLGSDFNYYKYDCSIDKFNKIEVVKNSKLVIVEGTYSLLPNFDKYYDLSIFLDIDSDIQIQRIVDRNGPSKLKDYVNKWIVYENKYFNFYNIKHKVDIYIKDFVIED